MLAAASLPGARKAEEQDFAESRSADGQKSVADWNRNYKGQGFESQEDMLAAISDPEYKQNENYRSAVRERINDTPEEIVGLVRPHRNVPTAESMLKAAKLEAYREGRDNLFKEANAGGPHAAAARLKLMEYEQSADPDVRQMLDEFEHDYAKAHPIETELKAAKLRGERVGTSAVPTPEEQAEIDAHPFDYGTAHPRAAAQRESGSDVDSNMAPGNFDPYSLDALADQSLRSAYWHYLNDNSTNSERTLSAKAWEKWYTQGTGKAQS